MNRFLKYQANVTYFIEMSINVTDNIYDATVWMLDASGEPDTPYCIAQIFPFRREESTPPMTIIDTIYPVNVHQSESFIIRDFKVVGGE